MKKIWYIITAIITVLIILTFFTNHDLDADKPESLTESLNQAPIIDNVKKQIVDFSLCDKNKSLLIPDKTSSAKLKILGPEKEDCNVETSFEIEGGSYVNECKVPKSLGIVTFDGSNFDKISPYCKLKTSGGDLIEYNNN